MKLALRELLRRPGRFAVAGVILTLIAILLMFLGGLLDVGQELFARHRAFGAVAVFLVALHCFERAEDAEFGFDGNTDRVRKLDDLLRRGDVVVERSDRLAVGFE